MWRGTQEESRCRYLQKFDSLEVANYEKWVQLLTEEDHEACLADIARHFQWRVGMQVLDAGAGTGALTQVLANLPELELTALEPAPAMVAALRKKEVLNKVPVIEAFCDGHQDRHVLPEASFDVIVSRQLINGLFDPLAAFANFHHWLKSGGALIALDGFYERGSWNGKWEEEVDVLPLSANQSLAMVPYLLEQAGFHIAVVEQMVATNARPSTRTKRFMVLAHKR